MMLNRPRPLVILESPYRGHGESEGEIKARTEWHIEYARRCIRDCLFRGEAPIASHLLYTQPGILRDDWPDERKLGIECGIEWLRVADYSVFYTDHGWSTGMLNAFLKSLSRDKDFRIRSLRGLKSIVVPPLIDDMSLVLSKYEDVRHEPLPS